MYKNSINEAKVSIPYECYRSTVTITIPATKGVDEQFVEPP